MGVLGPPWKVFKESNDVDMLGINSTQFSALKMNLGLTHI